jgi:CubicO group peptidase (beta-lactamase class C family)
MSQSFASVTDVKDTANLATPHSTGTGAIRTIAMLKVQVNGAPGGIVSNIDDMSKWMLLQLNKGKIRNNLEKKLFHGSKAARNVDDTYSNTGKS